MRALAWTFAAFLLGAAPAGPKDARPKRCPLLATRDAAEVLGPGTELYSASQKQQPAGKRSVLCFFGAGEGPSLAVRYNPAIPSDPRGAMELLEVMRKSSGGALEPGIGEYAYSARDEGSVAITVLQSGHTLELELKGKGLGPGALEKLRQAARVVARGL